MVYSPYLMTMPIIFNINDISIDDIPNIALIIIYLCFCSIVSLLLWCSSGALSTIYKFSVSFELTTNNVLIYNANSNYSFDLITDQVTIPISKIYIGDSNNKSQLANAYLYDETQTGWVNVNTGEVLTK